MVCGVVPRRSGVDGVQATGYGRTELPARECDRRVVQRLRGASIAGRSGRRSPEVRRRSTLRWRRAPPLLWERGGFATLEAWRRSSFARCRVDICRSRSERRSRCDRNSASSPPTSGRSPGFGSRRAMRCRRLNLAAVVGRPGSLRKLATERWAPVRSRSSQPPLPLGTVRTEGGEIHTGVTTRDGCEAAERLREPDTRILADDDVRAVSCWRGTSRAGVDDGGRRGSTW